MDDDFDLDDYEYLQSSMEGAADMGAFDDPDYDGRERVQGDYVAPWDATEEVDERVGIQPVSAPDFSERPEEPQQGIEVFDGMVPGNYLGISNPWDAYEGHGIFYEPARFEGEQRKHEERYYSNIGWERHRHRRLAKERYWRDPERARLIQRQKNKKHYYKLPEEERKRKARDAKAAYRARKKAERKQAKLLKDMEKPL